MLTYDMDARGDAALYEYLYHCIRADIVSGRLEAGRRLPSKRSLSQHLRISVTTVEGAYGQLAAEGYLFPRAKQGFFVAELESRPDPVASAIVLPVAEKGDYLLDLRGNRVNPAHFPFATWSRLMRQVLAEQDKKLLLPIPNQGVAELQKAIADYLGSFRGLSLSPEQVVVGAGTEYLYHLLIQLLGPSHRFAVEDPGYQKLQHIYRRGGVDCRSVPLDSQGLSMSHLALSEAEVAHISPSHHYPTGIVTSVSRRYELLRWAEQGRYIIEDDYDSEFRFTGHPIPPLQSLDDEGRVIYMNTFSQTIAPSMRISYMVLPPGLLEVYRRELGFYACTVPSFEQYTLAKFITGGWFEKHLSRMRNYYRLQRAQVLAAFRRSSFSHRVSISERGAGLHFLLRLDTAESDQSLKARAEAMGVGLSFLSEFSACPREEQAHTLVVSYSGLEPEGLEAAMALLSRLLQ